MYLFYKSFDTDSASWVEFYLYSTVTLKETRLRKELVQVEQSKGLSHVLIFLWILLVCVLKFQPVKEVLSNWLQMQLFALLVCMSFIRLQKSTPRVNMIPHLGLGERFRSMWILLWLISILNFEKEWTQVNQSKRSSSVWSVSQSCKM